MGVLKQVLAQIEEDNSEDAYSQIVDELTQPSTIKTIADLSVHFPKLDTKMVTRVAEIVNSVVTAGEKYSWSRYVSLLFSYVDWLYAHSLNTALISCVIAATLGYNNRQLVEIAIGALFHDIGLTLLPRETLNKPSKLTDLEYTMIKNHCEMGLSMLTNIDLPEVSKLIIIQHHERLDGTGYPFRLKGEEIHEASLITLITEYFETATAERSYKKAQPASEVIAVMKQQSHVFPAYIVDALDKYLV